MVNSGFNMPFGFGRRGGGTVSSSFSGVKTLYAKGTSGGITPALRVFNPPFDLGTESDPVGGDSLLRVHVEVQSSSTSAFVADAPSVHHYIQVFDNSDEHLSQYDIYMGVDLVGGDADLVASEHRVSQDSVAETFFFTKNSDLSGQCGTELTYLQQNGLIAFVTGGEEVHDFVGSTIVNTADNGGVRAHSSLESNFDDTTILQHFQDMQPIQLMIHQERYLRGVDNLPHGWTTEPPEIDSSGDFHPDFTLDESPSRFFPIRIHLASGDADPNQFNLYNISPDLTSIGAPTSFQDTNTLGISSMVSPDGTHTGEFLERLGGDFYIRFTNASDSSNWVIYQLGEFGYAVPDVYDLTYHSSNGDFFANLTNVTVDIGQF